MIQLNKDSAAGLIFIAIGGFFAIDALLHLRLGSAFSMGPGYFPLILGALLAGLGTAILVAGLRQASQPFGPVPWRGAGLTLGAIAIFAVCVRGAGFGPSLALALLMVGRASGKLSWTATLVLTVVLTVLSVLLFVEALGLPYPVIGKWIGG